MKNFSLITVVFFSFPVLVLSQEKWVIKSYSISFKIKHVAGAIAEGSFKDLKAEISFDPENLVNSSINANLSANTFQTGNSIRDKTIKGEDYLDVVKYPLISMKSVKITPKGNNTFEGIFRITIKSTTKEIPITFKFVQNGARGTFSSQFVINRLDFGVGEKSWMLANEATLNVLVETVQ